MEPLKIYTLKDTLDSINSIDVTAPLWLIIKAHTGSLNSIANIGKASMATTDIEKKSLEAHVELCAERYSNLETKLTNLDNRMDKIEGHIVDIKDSLAKVGGESNKTLITIGTAIFVALLTAVLGVVVHLATK